MAAGDLQWDGLDREVKRTFGNGMTTSHVYDAAGNETGLWTADKNGVTLARYTSTYNRTGYLLTSRELDGRRVTYLYDLGYRLGGEQWSGPAGISDWVYTYDSAGNRVRRTLDGLHTTFTYDTASRLTKVLEYGGATTTLAYDGNGNLAWEEGMTGARTTYTWDPENRLKAIALPSGSVQTNTYLRDGRRLRQTTDGVVKIYNWNALNLLLELDTSLAVQAEYTDYPGIWGGLASQRRGAVSSYYGFDFQEATRILVSTGGIVTDSAVYNAWGETISQSGSTENPYGYGGQVGYQSGEAAGLQYLRQRYYDPQTARFVSRDPIGFLGGLNLYAYSGGDPVNKVDPAGLDTLVVYGSDTGLPFSWQLFNNIRPRQDPGYGTVIVYCQPTLKQVKDWLTQAKEGDSFFFWGHGGDYPAVGGYLNITDSESLYVTDIRKIITERRRLGKGKLRSVVLRSCHSTATELSVNTWLDFANEVQGYVGNTVDKFPPRIGEMVRFTKPVTCDPGPTYLPGDRKWDAKNEAKKGSRSVPVPRQPYQIPNFHVSQPPIGNPFRLYRDGQGNPSRPNRRPRVPALPNRLTP